MRRRLTVVDTRVLVGAEFGSDSAVSKEIIPSSTQPGSAPVTGVRGLMLAVLEDGLRTYLQGSSLARRDAEEWVRSGRRDSPFSFCVLCEQFSLDPSAVRMILTQVRSSPGNIPRLRSRSNVRTMSQMAIPRSTGKRRPRWGDGAIDAIVQKVTM